jgi:hypothetical protein
VAVAAAAAVLAAGCSKEEEPVLPAACRGGTQAVLAALQSAPREVALEGNSLSDCMDMASSAGDVQELGAAYIGAAERLAARVREDPDGAAATQLGYLVGAARRGVERTIGIHEEVVRRMEDEVLALGRESEAFRTGERAGFEGG